ncbi:MAG: extracellular solute-binding protein [Pseudomonas sp.]|jgi:polar amino acid transport system substrate-binding protein|uniref:substrate-binding periplasmic protein n=1 Tax=Pseudomonas sp. TaxID=306 RepID=UPI00262F7B4D|nr:transporter substrate-binding domain-containing protein [Pseudomonas sp.]MDB6047923.1 extracellular solute-binding protein [Pseudomonas sp.]
MLAPTWFLTALLFACLSFTASGETLHIVTEPWAPYVYIENGQARGLDYETTAIVFERLGIDVKWEFLPWRRCLSMLQQGQADGALDIFKRSERDELLLYPSEPLSEVEWVLFDANARPHPFLTMEDLRGLTIGISPGYLYSTAFDASTVFTREPAPSHEANFGKLLLGRIDMVITDRRVGQYVLKQMKAQALVSQSSTVLGREPEYLALRRNAGMDLLVQRFGAELKRFKREPAYAELLSRYTGESMPAETLHAGEPEPSAATPNKTVEQQESGAR